MSSKGDIIYRKPNFDVLKETWPDREIVSEIGEGLSCKLQFLDIQTTVNNEKQENNYTNCSLRMVSLLTGRQRITTQHIVLGGIIP